MRKCHDIGLSNDVFGFDNKNKGNKSKNKQVGLHQIKKKPFYSGKETISKMKNQPMEWKKKYTNPHKSIKINIHSYKELTQLNSKQTDNLIIKWESELSAHFSKVDFQMASRYMKNCSTSLLRKCKQSPW